MHVGVVVPNISFCAAIRHRAKSERRGIVVRSLKLEGVGDRERRSQPSFCLGQELNVCKNNTDLGASFLFNHVFHWPGSSRRLEAASILFPTVSQYPAQGPAGCTMGICWIEFSGPILEVSQVAGGGQEMPTELK